MKTGTLQAKFSKKTRFLRKTASFGVKRSICIGLKEALWRAPVYAKIEIRCIIFTFYAEKQLKKSHFGYIL